MEFNPIAGYPNNVGITGGAIRNVEISDIEMADTASDTTLSGTPKIFTFQDAAGTAYYFKAYPTKA